MRKFIPALLAMTLLVLPVGAQEAIRAQYPLMFRSAARFTKSTVFTMGETEARATGNNAQLLNAIGTAWRLNAPLSSSTSAVQTSTLVIPGFALIFNAHALKVRIHGTTAANANTKSINFLFGSTSIPVMAAVAANAKDFYADIEIYRTALNSQQISVAGYANAAFLNGLSTTSAQVEGSPINVGISLPASTGAADVVVTGFEILGESG